MYVCVCGCCETVHSIHCCSAGQTWGQFWSVHRWSNPSHSVHTVVLRQRSPCTIGGAAAASTTRMDAQRQAMAWSTLFYDLHIMTMLIPAGLFRILWSAGTTTSSSSSSGSGGVDDALVAVWTMIALVYAAGSIRYVAMLSLVS